MGHFLVRSIFYTDGEGAERLAPKEVAGQLLLDGLEALGHLLEAERVVSQRLQQAFQGEAEWDMAQLTSLWEQVFDGREYVQGTSEFATAKSWVSDGWRDMGFQNADPTTDLRAMGMLGVHCLLRFTEAHTQGGK